MHQALSAVWNAANQICSKRLVLFMPEFVDALERFGHLSISRATRKKLLSMSPATVDRVLKIERSKAAKEISTKAGSLLKSKKTYQQLLASKHITTQKTEQLKEQFSSLDPLMLYKEIGIRQSKLREYGWQQEMRSLSSRQKSPPKPVIERP